MVLLTGNSGLSPTSNPHCSTALRKQIVQSNVNFKGRPLLQPCGRSCDVKLKVI